MGIVSVAIWSCNKQKKEIKYMPENSAKGNIKETVYKPTTTKEGHKQTMEFINHTDFCSKSKKSRSNYPDITVDFGAWVFESASNFLENQNAVRSATKTTYSIQIEKVNATTLSGADLTTDFNTFINQINNPSNGIIPRIINIYIIQETPTYVVIGADVYGSDEPMPQSITLPTFDMHYCDAKDSMNVYLDYFIHQAYVNYSTSCTCAVYFNTITNFPLGWFHATVGDGFLENKLWISKIANSGNLYGLFKASDWPAYYANAQDIANGTSDVVSRNLVNLILDCDTWNISATPFPNKANPAFYPPGAGFFEGNQHCIYALLFNSYIPVINN